MGRWKPCMSTAPLRHGFIEKHHEQSACYFTRATRTVRLATPTTMTQGVTERSTVWRSFTTNLHRWQCHYPSK